MRPAWARNYLPGSANSTPDDSDITVADPADLRAIAYALATGVSAEQAVDQAIAAARRTVALGRTPQ